MPSLLSRSQKQHDTMPSRSTPAKTRYHISSSEMRARYEMAQAIQKPWPVHLIENGTKPNVNAHGPDTAAPRSSASHETRSTKKRQSSPSLTISSAFGWHRRGSKDSAKSSDSSPASSPKYL